MPNSYNGWPASPDPAAIGIDKNAVARGTTVHFPPGLKSGDVAFVLGYVAGELHKRVERASSGIWGYAYRQNRNAANLSCHASGTAFDWNAPRHPNGKSGTFSATQVRNIHAILAEVEHAVKWGGAFKGTPDEMHYEICVNATTLRDVAKHLRAKLAVHPASAPYWFTRELFRGMNGSDIRTARHNLHLVLDGVKDDEWDSVLESAVRSIQNKSGLPVTGRINAATAKVIG